MDGDTGVVAAETEAWGGIQGGNRMTGPANAGMLLKPPPQDIGCCIGTKEEFTHRSASGKLEIAYFLLNLS